VTADHLQFTDHEAFMVGVSVLMEAGADWFSVGGNQVRINGGVALDAEQRAELDKLTVGALPALDGAPPPSEAQPELVPAAQVAALADATAPPPRSGPGASRDAWAAWLAGQNFQVGADASRDDMIAAWDQHVAAEAAAAQAAPTDTDATEAPDVS
jgi:hypothetical protein